ncbi:sensor histidine kinase [Clostridium sp. MD294]|uniref:sensor histidine kinase n=1 Tax=Clostridium sp. MD294 TaxID=97138 RepID=UPI0002CC4CF8|nr:sensor histidine kinase [Clostridium sp. MD294]NDO47633.1 GHKL domain-containing protein [Clostridium sp. MD294]USF30049.1 hypothetical protein C820_001472 [Clostridium sp. MD294]
MYALLSNTLYYIVTPVLFYFFFCLYCGIRFDYKHCFCYVLCCALLFHIELQYYNSFFTMLLELLLLALYGNIVSKCPFYKSILISVLIHSIHSICNGLMQMAFFWLLSKNPITQLMQYGDVISILMTSFLAVLLLLVFLKYFDQNMTVNSFSFLIMILPVFFISFVERIISNNIYGNTIVWNSNKGIVFPVVNHTTILLLQLFALVCLFTSLIAYQNIKKSIYSQQTIQLLKQQYHFQQNYIQEAQMRYEKTRSFRHDIKNHITVLSELLKQNLSEQAYQYLYHMEELSQNLSFTVQTGNVVVNALLSSKFSLAKQHHITIECDLKIPDDIKEIDCCIVLSNAIDNAITESTTIPQTQHRFITVKSNQKGNIYMLSIQNKCHKGMTAIPDMGIGLKNIKSICEKYNGTMQIELHNEIYHISMLFIISQQ